jgi:membrane protease YdiL (CAAX protease family)
MGGYKMSIANSTILEPTNPKRHKLVAWILLGGLLFLRIPFLMGLRILAPALWIETVFEVGTYLLTACLIYWEREHLTDFHIDKLALIMIILFKPVQTIMLIILGHKDRPLALPNLPGIAIWVIAFGLVVALWPSRKILPKFSIASLGWVGIGLVAGLLTTIILAYPGSFTISYSPFVLPRLLKDLPISFFTQIGYAAVSEEPLFRGFLWGFLLKCGWKNKWIWLFQAGLFMLSHFYYFNRYPFSFWILVPFCALVFGAVAWRSKTIAASMAAHAFSNSLGELSWFFVASLRM